MKLRMTILLGFIATLAFTQKNQTVDLNWKIKKGEKLEYATVMSDIDTSTIEMDLNGLFKSLSDSTASGIEESKDFFKKFNKLSTNLDFVSTLSSDQDGIIDIVMTTRRKENLHNSEIDSTNSDDIEIQGIMEAMQQGVMLRGSVYKSGEIHSFWVKTRQKNLISVMFELPAEPVKIGDKWPLDVHLISNDHNFKCDTSYKLNEVQLVNIKEVDGETIAVLKYNIVEYVEGNFISDILFTEEGGKKGSMMRLSHQGVAEFSIEEGRWIAYDAVMTFIATGVMNINKKTKFTLIRE